MALLRWLYDRPYLLLTLTALFWAGNAIVGRAVAGVIPPVALAQFRWTVAFLLLMPFAVGGIVSDLPAIRRHIGVLTVLSLTGISAFNTLLYWSLQYTTAINATLMQSSGPLLIGIWSMILFRDPLTRGQIAGVCVSLLGVIAIVTEGHPERLASFSLNVGDVAVLVAMAIYALYSTLLRKRPAVAPLSFVAVTMGLGAVLLLPLTIAEAFHGEGIGDFGPTAYFALLYVVLFPSILAYICFNRGVQLIGANRAGPFFHLIPLFGALMAVMFLGERPGLHHGVGALLIIGGVALASRRIGGKKRMADEPRSS